MDYAFDLLVSVVSKRVISIDALSFGSVFGPVKLYRISDDKISENETI